jgi:hypothetical protein
MHRSNYLTGHWSELALMGSMALVATVVAAPLFG